MIEFTIVLFKDRVAVFEIKNNNMKLFRFGGSEDIEYTDKKGYDKVIFDSIYDAVNEDSLEDVSFNFLYREISFDKLKPLLTKFNDCKSINVSCSEKELPVILLKLNKLSPGKTLIVNLDGDNYSVALTESGKSTVKPSTQKADFSLSDNELANYRLSNFKFISNHNEIDKVNKQVEELEAELQKYKDHFIKKMGLTLPDPENIKSDQMISSYDIKSSISNMSQNGKIIDVTKTRILISTIEDEIKVYLAAFQIKKCYGNSWQPLFKVGTKVKVDFVDKKALVTL